LAANNVTEVKRVFERSSACKHAEYQFLLAKWKTKTKKTSEPIN